MQIHTAKASATNVGFRVAGIVTGTLILLLAVLTFVRPEMMSVAAVHKLMSAIGL